MTTRACAPAAGSRTPAGVSHRQLDYWCRRGYLVPANGCEPGTGYTREWTDAEWAVAERMARLVAAGFEPVAAAEHARRGPGRHHLGDDVWLEVMR